MLKSCIKTDLLSNLIQFLKSRMGNESLSLSGTTSVEWDQGEKLPDRLAGAFHTPGRVAVTLCGSVMGTLFLGLLTDIVSFSPLSFPFAVSHLHEP